MACTIGGINLEQNVANAITSMAEGNMQRMVRYAKEFVTKDCQLAFNVNLALKTADDETVKNFLVDYINKKVVDVNSTASTKVNENLLGFNSMNALALAKRITIDGIITEYNKSVTNNVDMLSDDKLRIKLVSKFKKGLKDVYASILESENKTSNVVKPNKKDFENTDDYKAVLKAYNKTIIAEIQNYAKQNNDIRLNNILATINQLLSANNYKAWIDSIRKDPRVKAIMQKTDDSDSDIATGDNEDVDVVEGEESNTEYDEKVDTSTKRWSDNGGEYASFLNHISDDVVRSYFQSLPLVISNEADADGNFILDTNNELGMPVSVSYVDYIRAMKDYGDYSNKDRLIESLKRAARDNYEFRSLALIARDLENNKDLLAKVINTFGKPIAAKAIITVLADRIEMKQSNNAVNAQARLQFNLINSLKTTAINNASVDYTEDINELNSYLALKVYEKEDKAIISNKIYSILKQFYPDISKNSISAYIEHDGTIKKNIESLIGITKNTIEDSKKIVLEYGRRNAINAQIRHKNHIREAGTLPISYPTYPNEFTYPAEANVIDFSKKLVKFVAVKTEYNSRNAEGNLSSDIINNNFIMNLKEKLSSPEGIEVYMNFKTKGQYYTFSNILYEHISPDGEIIYGLFKKDEAGNVSATPYATSLLQMYLFNGAVDMESQNAVLYNGMSDGDYFISSVIAFKNSISLAQKLNKDISFGSYFMRTPSDAPKNFIISAPRYDYKKLFDYNLNDVKKRTFNYLYARYKNVLPKDDAEARTIRKEFNAAKENKYKLNDEGLVEIIDADYRAKFDAVDEQDIFYTYSINNKTKIIIKASKNKNGGVHIKSIVSNNKLTEDIYKSFILSYIENGITNDVVIQSDKTKINTRSALFSAYKNLIKGEIRNAVDAYQKMFRISSTGDIELAIPEGSTEEEFLRGFQELYFYNKTALKNGRPTGNVFDIANRSKVFNIIENGEVKYSVGNELVEVIENLYKDVINLQEVAKYDSSDNSVHINFDKYEDVIDDVLSEWFKELYKYTVNTYEERYKSMHDFHNSDIFDYVVNSTLMNANFDDLFEGDYMFYKNAQTFLKRDKEVQASGNPLLTNRLEELGGTIIDTDDIVIGDVVIKNRNGFNAVTIENRELPFNHAERMFHQLIDSGATQDTAGFIASKYGYKYIVDGKLKYDAEDITSDDAQSYITLEEFIRRATNKGDLKPYIPLLEKLLDPNVDINSLNPEVYKTFIQVQKHFYYDIQYDDKNNVYFPRQIKNAEFVLVPAFIKGTELEKINNWMHQNGIDQVNTKETSKATNKNVINVWNENDTLKDLTSPEFNTITQGVKQPYYYQFLYEQQKVPQHLVNAKNKAGIQIMKKILDNLPNTPEAQRLKNEFFRLYTTNIKVSYDKLIEELDIKDFEGKFEFGKDFFNKIYSLAADEVARLGLDSNMDDYVTLEDGTPIMPNFMNLVAGKIESIAQSIFNSRVTRQKLPGWHATQVSDVLFTGYLKDKDGNPRRLEYHPDIVDDKGNVTHEGYAEILLPKFTQSMFNQYDEEGNLKREIRIEDIDEDVLKGIGYRIPTEGKQSVSVIKIAGFLPSSYGSIVVLPEAWVAQTGADFDVDSVYGISYETYLGSDGRVHKIPYLDGEDEASIRKRYNYYTRRNGVKVEFTKVSDEEKDNVYSDIKLKVNSDNENNKQYLIDSFAEIMEYENDIYHALPDEDQDLIKTYYKDIKAVNKGKEEKDKIHFNEQITHLRDTFAIKRDAVKDNDKLYKLYNEFVDTHQTILNILDAFHNFKLEKLKSIKEVGSKTLRELYEKVVQEYYNKIENAAVEKGLMSYRDFARTPVEEQNSDKARNNRILDIMINIMLMPESLEENYSSSNFKDLIDANKYVDTQDPSGNRNRSPYNPFDQIAYMNDAMSGAKLKAFSVTRDTFNSVNNVAKTELDAEFTINVEYSLHESDYKLQNIIDAYGEERTHLTDYNTVIVKHNMLAWSLNNRNVVGKLLTPYSSQTTAHILDAIKEGAIKNENDYTFAAFKTLIDVGIDYKTAIRFLRQPVISRVVKAYNENKSIYVKGNFNPIHSAIKELAIENGITIAQKDKRIPVTRYTPINVVISAINDELNDQFNLDVTKKYGVNLNSEELNMRFYNDNIAEQKRNNFRFDMNVLIEFNKLNQIANSITALARVCNPDRFGAKQSIYATNKILDNIYKYTREGSIGEHFLVERMGRDIDGNRVKVKHNLIDAIYPNVNPEYVNPELHNINDSVYPSLAAFLRYSTMPSVEINKQLFATEQENFINVIFDIAKSADKDMSEKTYMSIKKYIISSIYSNTNFIKYPVIYDYKTNKYKIIDSDENGKIDPTTEFNRLYGYYSSVGTDFNPVDINHLTKEEIDKFMSLSPAQKVFFIKNKTTDNDNIFYYLEPNLFNNYKSQDGYSPQTIEFDETSIDKEDAYQLMRKDYYNSNPIVKATIVDIIKYAMSVEGYNFKHHTISKIIPNDILLDIKYDNTSFIQEIINAVNNIIPNNKIAEDYVRANYTNPDVVNNVIVKNVTDLNKYKFAGTMYKIPLFTDELIEVNGAMQNKTNEDFFKLKIGKETDNSMTFNSYVTITKKVNKKYITDLYRIIHPDRNNTFVYLIPLNFLEQNEHGTFSANPNNNNYYAPDYYVTLMSFDINRFFDTDDFKNNIHTIYKELSEKYGIKKDKKDASVNISETAVMELEDTSAKNFINRVNELMKYTENLPNDTREFVIFNNNPSMAKMFKQPAIQMIPNAENNNYYIINEVELPNKVAKLLNKFNEKEFSKLSFSNKLLYQELNSAYRTRTEGTNFKRGNHFYNVVPIENIVSNENEENTEGGASIISGVANNSNVDPLVTVAKNFQTVIQRDSNYRHSMTATQLIADFRKRGITFDTTSDIEENLEDVLVAQSEYVQEVVDIIFDKFEKLDYFNIPVDDPSIPEKLNNDAFRDFYIRLILNANNFSKSFDVIGDINYENASPKIKRAIDNIQKNINRLKNDNKSLKGIRNIMQWFADNFSTDPRIKNGFKSILEEYSDTDYSDWLFADISEIDNTSVQIIVKKVLAERYAAIMKGKEAARKFLNRVKELRATGNINNDNIIKDGKFIKTFDTKVYEDYRELKDKVAQSEKDYGKDSVEYHAANLAYQKFKAENFEQPYVKEYYTTINDIEYKFFNAYPKYYTKYKAIQNQISQIRSRSKDGNILDDDKKEFFALNRKLSAMRNEFREDVEPETPLYYAVKSTKNYFDTLRTTYDIYFEDRINRSFKKNLEANLAIIAKYEGTDTTDNLMNIKEYADAADWLENNTIEMFSETFQREYDKAIKALKDSSSKNKRKGFIPSFRKEVYDDNGALDPTKLTDEEIKKAKDAQLGNIDRVENDFASEASLIRVTNPKLPYYNREFYKNMPKGKGFGINNPKRLATINKINEILINHYDAKTNSIHTANFTEDELVQLINLYDDLTEYSKDKEKGKEVFEYIKNNGSFNVDLDYYNAQRQLVIDKYGKDSEYYKLWIGVNAGTEYNKRIKSEILKEDIPNRRLYGFIKAKDKFIDNEKTQAREFLDAHVAYITKQAFYDKYDEAVKAGKGKEWYEANTIVNPHTYRREPLRIWQERILKGEKGVDSESEIIYSPTGNQVKRNIKDEYYNYAYDELSFSYNHSNPKYNIDLGLTKEEQEYVDLCQDILKELTTNNYAGHKFVLRGNLPRRRIGESTSFVQALTGVADVLGYTANADNENGWRDLLDYSHDSDPKMPMLEELKGKGWKEYKRKREQEIGESDEDYTEAIKQIEEENAKIKENNDKISKALIDNDWDSVMADFIVNAYEYNARQQSKLYLYVLMDSLAAHDAYKITPFGTIKRDYENSFEGKNAYRTEKQDRTMSMLSTFMHRFIYDEYKKPSRYNKFGSIAQNIASAKYMMFNITGGIGNVLTGWNNIGMEAIAKDYFTVGEWVAANNDYFASLPSYFANIGSDKADNLTDALIKLYDVVDFTQITGQSIDTKTVSGIVQSIKDVMYSPQSMGERYMQNSALIAMMKNTKVYTDANGKTSLVTFDLFTRDKEDEAMFNVIKDNEELLQKYNDFIENIKVKKQEAIKYNRFRKTKNASFLRSIKDKDIAEKYFAEHKRLLKDAKEQFNKLETLKDQYTLVDGYAVLKPDSKVTTYMAGEFKDRVIKVNDKIHGVYNKIGAARIESEWWGGMVMQYHKHIYPGVMKRWRRKGTYNEARQSIEKGCYQSFFDFLTVEFNEAHNTTKELANNDYAQYLMKGIQNYSKAVLNTFINARFNWNTLDEWERNNIKRTLADFLTVTSALATSVALFAANKDDEYEDSLIWNLLVYEADKLASESMMYTPMGIMSEGKKLWSSPLAIMPSFQDGFKSLGLIANIIVNGEDFDPYYATGRYAGKNKLAVYITRNIPMYRAYKRLEDLDKNNSYYKLGNNAIGFFDAEAIANAITK